MFNAIVNLDISSPPDQEDFKALGFYPSDAQPGKFEFFIPDGSNVDSYYALLKDEYLPYLDPGLEAGNSVDDYTSIVLDTEGSLYDLGMLRVENSDYSSAFVNSFVATQVQEIENSETFGDLQTVTNAQGGETVSEVEAPPPTSDPPPSTGGTGTGGSVLGDPHCKFNRSIDRSLFTMSCIDDDTFLNFPFVPICLLACFLPPSLPSIKYTVKTWQNEHYEYHGQCDMVLVKDPNFANGLGLDIHIRSKLVRYWSYIQSVAIRIGTDILELQGSADEEDYGFHYWINYEYQAEIDTLGGFPIKGHSKKVHSHKNNFEIDLTSAFNGNGPKILISSFKEFLKVEFENASEEAFGRSVGLLGDFKTGKTLARDGSTVFDDFTDLGQEWQVVPSDGHIFQETSTPHFPDLCIEPEDPRGDRARRLAESTITGEQAEEACAKLSDPIDRKDCVYDILATQDIDMVGAY